MKAPSIALFLISFVLLHPCIAQTNTQVSSPEHEAQIDEIFEEFDDIRHPGAAVAVAKDGKIIFQKGYGSANLEYGIPVTPQTVFHIASVSKQFTVFALLLLAEEGKLSFEDDIRKYIPEMADFGHTITLRHLASHTSGLRDHWDLLSMAGWRMDDVITTEHLLHIVARQKQLNFEPGEAYLYSNTGFTLLAEVVARVSGQSFASFTHNRIFKPLGMSHTLFYDDHEKIVENRAYSYDRRGEGYKKRVLSFSNVGATSLFTTVEDISQWAMNFASPKVGNPQIFKQMRTLAKLNNGQTFGGAYGQFVNEYKGLRQIFHSGSDAGYRSFLTRFPDQGLSVAVFSTFADTDTEELALNVAEVFLRNEMGSQPTPPIPDAQAINPTKEDLEKFTGSYWNEDRFLARKIYLEDDQLMYRRSENNGSALAPIAENTFKMLDLPVFVEVRFENEEGNRKMYVNVNYNDSLEFVGFDPVDHTPSNLEEFSGRFYSEELDTYYTIVVKDQQLVITHPRMSDIPLTPIQKDMFEADRWFLRNVKFVRDKRKRISGLTISGGRVKNLSFEKMAKRKR